MAPHLFDELYLITLQENFFVFFAAGSALSTFLEDGFEVGIVGYGLCHCLFCLVRLSRIVVWDGHRESFRLVEQRGFPGE